MPITHPDGDGDDEVTDTLDPQEAVEREPRPQFDDNISLSCQTVFLSNIISLYVIFIHQICTSYTFTYHIYINLFLG